MHERLEAFDALEEAEKIARRESVRVLVITGLGLNCEVETDHAFRLAGATSERVHLLDLLEGQDSPRFSDYGILAFIGGFAFGDHLGAGFVFANKIRHKLYEQLLEFIEGGGLALGICNGFQTMVRLGLLPGLDGDYRTPRAALAPLELPARHGEGKFLTEDDALLARLERDGQVAARYVDGDGKPTEAWPANPNGSPGGVAGVCDPSGRLFGMMPHPDAFHYPFHQPRWERRIADGALPAEGDGMRIFRNGVDAAAALV